MSHIIVEGDAMGVVNTLNSDLFNFSLLGNIFDEAKTLISEFSMCTINHVRREANSTAHTLARGALRNQEAHLWLDEFPSDVMSICLSECNDSS
ncbi:hypothetical protein PTKIN_Ptkin09bG0279500 [Pterospermum kingtungense]